MTLIADVFPEIGTPKDVVEYCLESPVSEDPSTGNIVNNPHTVEI